MKLFFVIGSICGFLSVALGAFGAHGLEGKITDKLLQVWKTGVQYQMFGTVLLFVIAFLTVRMQQIAILQWAGWLSIIGILLFSGSLYVMSMTGVKWLGAITPLGGIAFLVAWVLVGIVAVKYL